LRRAYSASLATLAVAVALFSRPLPANLRLATSRDGSGCHPADGARRLFTDPGVAGTSGTGSQEAQRCPDLVCRSAFEPGAANRHADHFGGRGPHADLDGVAPVKALVPLGTANGVKPSKPRFLFGPRCHSIGTRKSRVVCAAFLSASPVPDSLHLQLRHGGIAARISRRLPRCRASISPDRRLALTSCG
jgi:hypothetical protein